MGKSFARQASDRIRILIALPFNMFAHASSLDAPHEKQSVFARMADWVNTHILPDDRD